MEIRIKRVYAEAEASDGFRVLVDRLWPRGIAKEKADLSLWLKEIAPSTELRTAFHHDGMPFDEFARAYTAELAEHQDALDALRQSIAGHDVVTLLFSSQDADHTHAGLLRDALAA
jgi:uncharacterized protein YeaO (DUF488 family)